MSNIHKSTFSAPALGAGGPKFRIRWLIKKRAKRCWVKFPSSHLEREENRKRFWKRGPHRKDPEGDVLRPSQKRE